MAFHTCFCFVFQHTFIKDATNSKPIMQLLAEYKAEIVEDEIIDDPDEKMDVRIILDY